MLQLEDLLLEIDHVAHVVMLALAFRTAAATSGRSPWLPALASVGALGVEAAAMEGVGADVAMTDGSCSGVGAVGSVVADPVVPEEP